MARPLLTRLLRNSPLLPVSTPRTRSLAVTAVLWGALNGVALGSPVLPERVHAYLDRVKPELAGAIAADTRLLRDVGARRADDLTAATYDFARELRFFRLDGRRLAHAARLSDALIPSDRYCVPYCVIGVCKAMLCFRYDQQTELTSLLSVDRSDRTARLQEGAQRLRSFVPQSAPSHRIVVVEAQEFLLATDADTGVELLVPATSEQAQHLASAAGGRRMDTVSLREARVLFTGAQLGAMRAAPPAAADADARPAPRALMVDHSAATGFGGGSGVALAAGPDGGVEDIDGFVPNTIERGPSFLAPLRHRWQQISFFAVGFLILGVRYRKRRLGPI